MVSDDDLDSRLCKEIAKRDSLPNPRSFGDRLNERPQSRQGYRPRRSDDYSNQGYGDRRRVNRPDYSDRKRSQATGGNYGGHSGDFD